MIEIQVPGVGVFEIDHLVCDVNGTLALDGQLLEGVAQKISTLRDRLTIHLLTADTHGRQEAIDRQLNLKAVRITPGSEDIQKAVYVRRLGSEHVAAIGQGANDAAMLKEAALGICVHSPEGSATQTLMASDLVLPDILHALELFEKPLRLLATMRK
jgi:P-type E1-E2 ATPase